MRKREEFQTEWELVSDNTKAGRVYYTFDSKEYSDTVQITISISNMFRNPEEEAWRMLDALVV
ncbi:hypothetical protein [Paenibacillus silvae]|uniref:Uncharacterized protein n=1 Tax=Paenibacillus silvae TaxID=1325358 RepID=A0A2W6N7W4_9BACL|nr:hypothetical protein [Paenibacillus silvae]PZT52007.1 hypothetical protein DN757_29725 [Paenibacillus silvae]